jgi:hypothetical protein
MGIGARRTAENLEELKAGNGSLIAIKTASRALATTQHHQLMQEIAGRKRAIPIC